MKIARSTAHGRGCDFESHLEVGELDGEVGVFGEAVDHELHLPGVGAEPVAHIDADSPHNNVHKTVHLRVKIGPED